MSADDFAYVGVDVCFSKRKRLPIVLCVWREQQLVALPLRQCNKLSPPLGGGNSAVLNQDLLLQYAEDASQYIARICDHFQLSLQSIGLDAPLQPRQDYLSRRGAEAALDRAGIHCFTTPSYRQVDEIRRKVATHLQQGKPLNRLPHASQLWMLAGFALAKSLGKLAPCIEVYPQATVRRLGAGKRHKTSSGAAVEQLGRVAQYTRWPEGNGAMATLRQSCFGAAHDCVDAYISAWTASLPAERRFAFGEPDGDAIWIPRVEVT